jgi:hypothetical protein
MHVALYLVLIVSSLVGVAIGLNIIVYTHFSMKDGRLLKVTHPAISLDSTILRRALGTDGPAGYMTAAYTEVRTHIHTIAGHCVGQLTVRYTCTHHTGIQ